MRIRIPKDIDSYEIFAQLPDRVASKMLYAGEKDMSEDNGENGGSSTRADERTEQVRQAFNAKREDEQARDSGSRQGPHDVQPWPGDPGLEPAALALPDPEEERSTAVMLGETTQSISRSDLEENGKFFEGFHGPPAEIRSNAVRSQAERVIAAPTKARDTTDARMAVEGAEGERARAEAQRLEQDKSRFESEVVEARERLDNAKHQVEVREEEREQQLDASVGQPEPSDRQPTPTPAEQIGLTGWKLAVLMVMEIVLALLQLDPTISRVVPATFSLEPELIAGGIALSLQLSAFAVGRLIVVIELPQRLAALLFVGCFGFAAAQFVPALNVLRQGSVDGMTALTWVSVMVATIATATGWASGLKDRFERRLAVYRVQPEHIAQRGEEQIRYRDEKVAQAIDAVNEATEHLRAREGVLEQYRQTIANLWSIVEATPGRVVREHLVGEEAKAEIATETSMAEIMVESEVQHRDWLVNISRMAWFRRRSMIHPKTDTSYTMEVSSMQKATRSGTPVTAFAAILSLIAGSIAGAAASSLLALACGSGLAAVLFGLSLLSAKAASLEADTRSIYARVIHPINGNSSHSPWKWLPDQMRPRDGGTMDTDTNDIT
jgi:hypothetical protein